MFRLDRLLVVLPAILNFQAFNSSSPPSPTTIFSSILLSRSFQFVPFFNLFRIDLERRYCCLSLSAVSKGCCRTQIAVQTYDPQFTKHSQRQLLRTRRTSFNTKSLNSSNTQKQYVHTAFSPRPLRCVAILGVGSSRTQPQNNICR